MTEPVLLVLECSPAGDDSVSRRMGQTLVEGLKASQPGLLVRRRDLAANPLPPIEAAGVDPAIATDLLSELAQSNQLLITSPVHNYTVPVALKAWIDHVLRPGLGFRLTPQGKEGLLKDRPTWVAVSAGGGVFGDGPRQPDFFRPYLTEVLRTIGITDVRFVSFDRTVQRVDAASEAEQFTRVWMKDGQSLASGDEAS